MVISTTDIQWLRQETGVGMMQAKKALEAVSGDRDQALEQLRKAGAKIAASKSSRTVKDGGIGLATSPEQDRAALVSLACETDFVARTPDFQALTNALAAALLAANDPAMTVESFMKAPTQDGTVTDTVNGAIARMGENMQVTGIAMVAGTAVGSYVHSNRKVGALVAFDGAADATLAHDVAMHIAGMNPQFRSADDVPPATKDHEEEIFRAQLKDEGKPEAMWVKILPGKMAKYFADNCLLEQPFLIDDSLTVRKRLAQAGANLAISNFQRLSV